MLTVTDVDARPISEYLKVYHDARKEYKYLYFCKRCILNFDTKERTSRCNRCNKTSVVELPKEAPFEKQEKFLEKSNQWIKLLSIKLRELLKRINDLDDRGKNDSQNNTLLQGLYMHILRIRLLFHYLTT